jgi:hypothetical protein
MHDHWVACAARYPHKQPFLHPLLHSPGGASLHPLAHFRMKRHCRAPSSNHGPRLMHTGCCVAHDAATGELLPGVP